MGIRISDQGTFTRLGKLWTALTPSIGGGLRTPRNHVKTPADLFSFSHLRNAARLDDSRLGALRTASMREEGFRGTVDEQVGRWQKAREQDAANHRIGIGLPMSNIYAT